MRRRTRQFSAKVVEMNVVPYIDVLLVLLVIFMVTAPMLNQGILVNLPQQHAQTLPSDKTWPIIISVDDQGQNYLNILSEPDKPVALDVMLVRLKAERARDPNRLILLKGDGAVHYQTIAKTLSQLQQAGVSSVGLMMDKTQS